MNNQTDEPAVLVPVSRAALAKLDADTTVEECIELWASLENAREVVDGEEAGEDTDR